MTEAEGEAPHEAQDTVVADTSTPESTGTPAEK